MFSTFFLGICTFVLICGAIYAIASIGDGIPEDR